MIIRLTVITQNGILLAMSDATPYKLLQRRIQYRTKVTFPNGEIFGVESTAATPLLKAVLEIFALRFLAVPAAVRVCLPGSGADVRGRDHCDALGFSEADVNTLPNMIL